MYEILSVSGQSVRCELLTEGGQSVQCEVLETVDRV